MHRSTAAKPCVRKICNHATFSLQHIRFEFLCYFSFAWFCFITGNLLLSYPLECSIFLYFFNWIITLPWMVITSIISPKIMWKIVYLSFYWNIRFFFAIDNIHSSEQSSKKWVYCADYTYMNWKIAKAFICKRELEIFPMWCIWISVDSADMRIQQHIWCAGHFEFQTIWCNGSFSSISQQSHWKNISANIMNKIGSAAFTMRCTPSDCYQKLSALPLLQSDEAIIEI